MTLTRTLLAAAFGASLLTQAAVTQGQKFGDWEGACEAGQCGVFQVKSNGENVPVGRIILQKMPQAGNNPVMIITVPLGVNLHAGMGIAIDTKELQRLPFDFCDPNGCNVALPLQGEVLNKVKAGSKMQVAAFVGDKQQTIEFSLKGVTAAINAL